MSQMPVQIFVALFAARDPIRMLAIVLAISAEPWPPDRRRRCGNCSWF
jgi:small neutral amino acid transporter SnatA (MarC family)